MRTLTILSACLSLVGCAAQKTAQQVAEAPNAAIEVVKAGFQGANLDRILAEADVDARDPGVSVEGEVGTVGVFRGAYKITGVSVRARAEAQGTNPEVTAPIDTRTTTEQDVDAALRLLEAVKTAQAEAEPQPASPPAASQPAE